MFERTSEVASGVYADIARRFRYLFKRVRILEYPLRSEAVQAGLLLREDEPMVASEEMAFVAESVREPMPQAKVTVSDIDISYGVREVEMFERVAVTVEPMVMEELALVSLSAGLEMSLPASSRVPVQMPHWRFRAFGDWLETPLRQRVPLMTDRVTIASSPTLRRRQTVPAGQSFLRELPIRRKRMPMHLVSEQEKDEAWHKLLADSGLLAQDVSFIGIFDSIPVNRVKRIVADEEGTYVDLYLKRGYLDKESPAAQLILGRSKRDGALLKSIRMRP